MNSRRLVFNWVVGFALATGVSLAHAVQIQVSQESVPGAGDFDANVLGDIEAYSTALTIAAFYQYSVPNAASYNGELNGGPVPLSATTQAFFVDAADGLHYVVVHDNPNDGSGGNTRMTTTLLGGAGGTVGFSVGDDPAEGMSISDVVSDRILDTAHGWAPCCTDGYAIGSLPPGSVLYAQFDVAPTGISSWLSPGNSLGDIFLMLDPGRRVRYSLSSQVPEPATVILIGLGFAGLGYLHRKRIKGR